MNRSEGDGLLQALDLSLGEKGTWYMKKMSTSDADCSYGKEVECSEIIIDVKDVGPVWRNSSCCIYKVPNKLREVREEAYTPKLISIGPVHHNKKEQDNKEQDNNKEQDTKKDLENMESLKLRYFKKFFFQRTFKGQEEFANIIEKREKNIRDCYAEEISLPEKKDFVKMILLDSIFIIELFLRTASRSGYEKDDYILSKPWLEEGIKHDLILLENQLPFFILEQLYHHIGVFPEDRSSFLELACKYFFGEKKFSIVNKVKHFTDLQRYFYYSPKLKTGEIIEHLHSATKLDTAGLNFKKWKEEPSEVEDRRLLDIQIEYPDPLKIFPCFNCSWLLRCFPSLKLMQTTLVIPRFVIDHGTEHIFRNIMALEQCHYPFQAYICNYIVLLNFLIITSDDVELLVDKEIIVNYLGSHKEVAKMVNKLGKGIVEKNSCYFQVAKKLKEHSEYWWNKNIVYFKTEFSRDIWRSATTFFGIMVMLATIGSFLTPFVYHK